VVAYPDAAIQYGAVMVKAKDAGVANPAMVGEGWPEDFT